MLFYISISDWIFRCSIADPAAIRSETPENVSDVTVLSTRYGASTGNQTRAICVVVESPSTVIQTINENLQIRRQYWQDLQISRFYINTERDLNLNVQINHYSNGNSTLAIVGNFTNVTIRII